MTMPSRNRLPWFAFYARDWIDDDLLAGLDLDGVSIISSRSPLEGHRRIIFERQTKSNEPSGSGSHGQ